MANLEMEKKKNLSESAICTGSEMNHRTFGDDESWNSLQSTILAGHVSTDNSSVFSEENFKELTTVNEESSMLLKEILRNESVIIDENILNINIDAISDDDVFVDSPVHPRQPFRSTLRIDIPPSPKDTPHQVSSTQVATNEYLDFFDCNSVSNNGTGKERTGALLVQVIDDYNDIKYHAQSTPKLSPESQCTSRIGTSQNLTNENNEKRCGSSDEGLASSSESIIYESNGRDRNRASAFNFSPRRIMKINSASSDDCISEDPANKENFYKGKYSRAVNIVPKMPKTPVVTRPLKVALIKEFFENCCKTSELSYRNLKSRNSPTIRKIISESRTFNNVRFKKSSPSYTRKHQPLSRNQKGKITPGLKKTIVKSTLNSAKGIKILHYRNHENKYSKNYCSARTSSCTEFSRDSLYNTESFEDSIDSKSRKSRSTSDLPRTSASTAGWSSTFEIKKILKRPCVLMNQRSTLHQKSPKKSPKKQSKTSSIMTRRSLEFVSSPVKPVNELRKLFSPSVRSMENQINKRNVPKLPRVIVDGELKL